MSRFGEQYDTIEEAAQAGLTPMQAKYGTYIYQDPDTDKYYTDGAFAVTKISIGRGCSTHEGIAKLMPNGEIVYREKSLQPGDITFHQGSTYHVDGVGNPKYGLYNEHRVATAGRLPSFRKQMREQGYTIIREDAAKRTAVARKVAATSPNWPYAEPRGNT